MLKSDVNQITAGAGAVLARQLEADITGSDRFVSQSSTEKRARVTELHHRRQFGSYPETLVLYRMRPIRRAQVGSGRGAGRVRYSCLKEAARG